MSTASLKDDEKGFYCTNCQKRHEYNWYVYAHTHIELVHTCTCGKKHIVIDLNATPEELFDGQS